MGNHFINQADASPDTGYPEPPGSGDWITDHAWISGMAGLFMALFTAVSYHFTGALEKGVILAGVHLTQNRMDSILLALVTIAWVMLAVETARLWLRDRDNFFNIDPNLKNRHYGAFLKDAVKNWICCLALLGAAIVFFKTAGEYGYAKNSDYYQAWFRFLELAWSVYLWGGLPYVLITRALKHNPVADRRDVSALVQRVFCRLASCLPGLNHLRPEFNEMDKKAASGLLVKLFFAPLMTVFFAGQFPLLIDGIHLLTAAIPGQIAGGNYTHGQFNADLFMIGVSVIATIDVALAWCGYTVSSRWVDNATVSAEPTLPGWLTCLACYPPFQELPGVYYNAPPEQGILEFAHPWFVTVFVIMMILSYLVYMSATLWFGVRFSNLTNRGIIRRGPYAVIRHPAYASKNFAWWCVMFPVIVYNAIFADPVTAVLQIIGLVFMTWLYYLRAMTEERHLSADPYYREYCRQVRYRFIPGII